MGAVNDKKKGKRVGILIKISSITTVIVILTVVALSIISITTMKNVSLKAAVIMAEEKLKGDIESC
jgi:heme/copper-type cytochrome/quinol oxidase subunit 2